MWLGVLLSGFASGRGRALLSLEAPFFVAMWQLPGLLAPTISLERIDTALALEMPRTLTASSACLFLQIRPIQNYQGPFRALLGAQPSLGLVGLGSF